MESTNQCSINNIEGSFCVPVWYRCDRQGRPIRLASDEEELVEKSRLTAEAEKYFCARGLFLTDWTEVTEHLSDAVPALVPA
ncbi:hypothetical protein BGM19_26710 [Streptomyces agglomeratus]|uniref:hypothetical protein n=1 Tax=Streptomyces agglomeratus TaxID=285458 RepID=UPI000868B666|nr:hypothetical protein [Streptomyces agglomeratus]OEJ61068.1 hypothetical protein BGM19_26710 [Streptomyces agglomeratus]